MLLIRLIPVIFLSLISCTHYQSNTVEMANHQNLTSKKTVNAVDKDEIDKSVSKTELKKESNQWQLTGAIAARYNNKGWTATINWQQQSFNNYQIRLSGPMGNGTVLITEKSGVVRYQDGKNVETSNNAEQLLLKRTGVKLPVQYLTYWVRGLAAPGAKSAQYDGNQQMVLLKQQNYLITYGDYIKIGKVTRPKQIKLQGPGVTVKLIIKHWD